MAPARVVVREPMYSTSPRPRLSFRITRTAGLAAAFALTLGTATAHAAAGDLDSSFSEDGRQTTLFESPTGSFGADTAIQADGKIVVVGNAAGDFAIARYTPEGELDPTFSEDGRETTNITANREGELSVDTARAVAVQLDGRIVVVGTAFSRTSSISETDRPQTAAVRYNADGSLDTTFGGDGRVNAGFSRLADVLIRPDGKLLLVGDSKQPDDGGCSDFVVTRLNPDGSIDGGSSTDFGTAPVVRGCATEDVAFAAALQPNGKLVVAGASTLREGGQVGPGRDRFAVARYRPNGRPDRSFSDDGRRVNRFTPRRARSEAKGVAVQPNGRIVLVGSLETRDGFILALTRYRVDGSLDESFSKDGRQETRSMGPGTDVALQADGRLLVSGSTGSDFGLARYQTNGRLDTSFSEDGRVRTNFGSGPAQADAVALQSDGRILLAGDYNSPQEGRAFALARYLP